MSDAYALFSLLYRKSHYHLKESALKRILTLTMALLVAAPAFATDNASERGRAIALERKARDSGWTTTQAQTTMVLKNAQGNSAQRNMRIDTLEIRDDGDKSRVLFQSPKDVEGTTFLSHSHPTSPDDQWIFLPALKRVKRISSSNQSGPFMGSEFAYEDMNSFEVDKYTYEYLRDDHYSGKSVYVLAQYPAYENSGYSKLIVWLDQEHFRVMKINFFDRKGELMKTLVPSDYRLFEDKYWRPMISHMSNVQTQKSTQLITNSITFGVELEDSDFTKQAIQRLR